MLCTTHARDFMDVTFTSHRVLWDRFYNFHLETGGFPGGSMVKNPPTKQDPWAWSLGGDDPLEKEMATHFNICVWEIPWTEESGGLQSMGSKKSQNNWATKPPANLGWFDVKIHILFTSYVSSDLKNRRKKILTSPNAEVGWENKGNRKQFCQKWT